MTREPATPLKVFDSVEAAELLSQTILPSPHPPVQHRCNHPPTDKWHRLLHVTARQTLKQSIVWCELDHPDRREATVDSGRWGGWWSRTPIQQKPFWDGCDLQGDVFNIITRCKETTLTKLPSSLVWGEEPELIPFLGSYILNKGRELLDC